jgi:hydrogenase nickel insertion protein HypA
MDRVEREAQARHARAVRAVVVRIGELSGVDEGLLRTAYENLRAHTACERAAIEIAVVPVEWGCRACGGGVPREGPLRCPACGGAAVLRAGDELLLERIEMEVA